MADPLLIRTYHFEYLFSLVFYSLLKNDGRIELRIAIIFFLSLFFNLCHDCFIYK